MSPLPPNGKAPRLPPSEVFEFVRAMHDFEPVAGSTTCLSFSAGQVIRTLNKDSSGWWDGELDGQRGWFPSNYVEVIPADKAWAAMSAKDAQDAFSVSTKDQSSTSMRSDSSSNGRSRNGSDATSHTLGSDGGWASPQMSSIESGNLEAIQQAMTLLRNAVTGHRVAHFQPSTACVISSVRTVLSSTDCLTRESQVLKIHPSLVAERKRILTSLASLVDRARRASSPATSEADRSRDIEKMLDLAGAVEGSVRHFLGVAARLGVKSTAVAPVEGEGEAGARKPIVRANQQIKPPPDLRAARSMSDMNRRARPKLRVQEAPPIPQREDEPRSPASQEEAPLTPSLTDASSSRSDSGGPPTPGTRQLAIHSAEQLLSILSSIHDHLLSTIAAFIGHVHAHTRASHSASYAYLIDMTRETIEKVREVLVVVEAVSNHPELVLGKPSELGVLSGSREALYVATTSLVTAARIATSAPVGDEEEERKSLLSSATAVLRSGGDCIAAIKLCVTTRKGDSAVDFELTLPELDRPSRSDSDRATTASPAPMDTATREEDELKTSSKRGPHTLSMLGRKATSLSCLRDKYQTDVGISSVAEDDEEERSEDAPADTSDRVERLRDNASRDSKRSSVNSLRKSQLSLSRQVHSRTSSRASSRNESREVSVPMSRGDSSRTSQSATSSRSGNSHTSTNDTSPRSSLNNTADVTLSGSKLASAPAAPTYSINAPSTVSFNSPQSLSVSRLSMGSTMSKDERPWFLKRDYEAREISFNGDGHVTGGTLRCLVERMTLHDTTIDVTFSTTFFLTFRMFTTPMELCRALFDRFELSAPTSQGELTSEELKQWTATKATPIRLRIYNFFKMWVELYWQADTDVVVVEPILTFCRETLAKFMASAAQRLVDLVQKRTLVASPVPTGPRPAMSRMKSTDKLRGGRGAEANEDPYSLPAMPGYARPSPIVTKGLLSSLRSLSDSGSVIDIDPLELARQLTIMESRIYCRIQPEELLGQDFSKKGSSSVNVRAMSTLSTRLTGWIAETILNEQDARRRTSLVKYFIKLSDRCLQLSNYNTLMAVLCALNSSTISRLRKTWDGLPAKYRVLLDTLRKATEHSRNYAEYRARIRSSVPPCLPFLGLFLTDLTFSYEGNPAERPSPVEPTFRLINFDRYQKISRIVGELQRFQVPYTLQEVPEIQSYLSRALEGLQHGGDVTSLYRQSLMVEPRDLTVPSYTPRPGDSNLFNWK